MNQTESAYRELLALSREVALFGSIGSVLGWDERVMLPAGGAEHRSNQMALLARKVHEQFTSPRIGELLGIIESGGPRGGDGGGGDGDDRGDVEANVRETRRLYDRATKLPGALVEE